MSTHKCVCAEIRKDMSMFRMKKAPYLLLFEDYMGTSGKQSIRRNSSFSDYSKRFWDMLKK